MFTVLSCTIFLEKKNRKEYKEILLSNLEQHLEKVHLFTDFLKIWFYLHSHNAPP